MLVAEGAVAIQVDEPFFSTGVSELPARLELVDNLVKGLEVPAIMHVEDKDRRPALVQEEKLATTPEPVYVTAE